MITLINKYDFMNLKMFFFYEYFYKNDAKKDFEITFKILDTFLHRNHFLI